MKYTAVVTSIGDSVLQFLQIRNSIIIFDKDVPYAYENMVVSHTKNHLNENIVIGDTLCIGNMKYNVLDVGNCANDTLRQNGHCTIVFNQGCPVEMPGQIAVEGQALPRIMIGDIISFE